MFEWMRWLEGSQTLGRGPRFWASLVGVVVLLLLVPAFASDFVVGNAGYLLLWVFVSMGLTLLWGTAGILSLGQTAYVGIAGYVYGICATNWGTAHGATLAGAAAALAAAALVAAVMGWVMFYGGVRDVFVGIVTLSFTLVLEVFMSQTGGPQWAVGEARLNGFNGMSGMPPLTLPLPDGAEVAIEGNLFYWFVLALGVLTYLSLRVLVNSPFGLLLVAIRENPARAAALGYDVRFHQWLTFVVAGALAGITGILYTSWGTYITPSVMGLSAAAMPIIWVAAGGKRDLGAAVASTVGLIWLSQMLSVHGSQYALVLMGALLLAVVLWLPEGIVPGISAAWARWRARGGA